MPRLLLILLSCLLLPVAFAGHAIALGYTPKYPAGFTHFEYVNPDAPKGGSLQLPNPDRRTSFDSFNPFIIKGTSAAGLTLLMFESLLASSEDEPASGYGLLADDVAVAPDELSVTFRVNPAARFSNGDPVRAADVKYSFDTLVSTKASPQFRAMLSDVKRVQVLDLRRIRFEFGRRNPELPLIIGSLPVFSRKWGGGLAIDRIALQPPIASGPYLIEAYQNGRQLTYRRNPNYWGKDLPTRRGMFNFDRITYRYYKDEVARLEAFKAGEFDFIVENSAKNWVRQYLGPKFRSGELVKSTFRHHNTAGMQGFILNSRRPQFADPRVRRALGLALDFEWLNRQYFYGQYTRLDSYWANSELTATGLPGPDELKLLEPLRKQLSPEVFGPARLPSDTRPPHSLRANLLEARELLRQAGWTYRDGALRNAAGKPFEFEFMDDSGPMLRVFLALSRNLEKLGIRGSPRTVDYALYQRRMDEFDFDMTTLRFPDSQSPGNELYDYFSRKSADTKGTGNFMGVRDPAVDKLIDAVVASENRAQRVIAVRALDRVLRQADYVIPHWYSAEHRVAYSQRLDYPRHLPRYYSAEPWMVSSWWFKP
ncbi:ABC transporter substrate-binding protein [Chitiniphilus shinanonensis]|uniref:ABC transporter substrate-binding protein n=1 Tax=Chitiniphilus shinanonensis TaxID=553088 RepID=A0ABQ6BR72_9NEIS|nr:extracellular solute-binding protein [Chitiniphilus shinanonensis]GLS04493.1 ABC transporter substrate-binding protein [Chitiniphilus shinanonensis]